MIKILDWIIRFILFIIYISTVGNINLLMCLILWDSRFMELTEKGVDILMKRNK